MIARCRVPGMHPLRLRLPGSGYLSAIAVGCRIPGIYPPWLRFAGFRVSIRYNCDFSDLGKDLQTICIFNETFVCKTFGWTSLLFVV